MTYSVCVEMSVDVGCDAMFSFKCRFLSFVADDSVCSFFSTSHNKDHIAEYSVVVVDVTA